jgi:transposase
MGKRRLSVRKIREVLRLKEGNVLSDRQVAGAVHVSPSTIADVVRRAAAAGLSWPLPEDMGDEELEALLYPKPEGERARPLPEMKYLHAELARPHVTLALLWEEYAAEYPDDHYSYQQLARLYRSFRESIETTMRQVHKAGEKVFTDFAGQTLPIVDPSTGEIKGAKVFVASMGFSNYTYAEAFASEKLPCWIAGHVNAFAYFGAAPEIIVPDNPRAIVTKADRYEPDLNRTFVEMAETYGCAIIPARVGHPKDKPKVESGVLQSERWILAALRNRVFHSLPEANQAIGERLEWLNDRKMKGVDASRRELFETVDLPEMIPLPATPYVYGDWRDAKVNIDYHVTVDWHHYSVPYQLTRKEVDVKLTSATVEVFHKGHRVASHPRSFVKGGFTTLKEHMPASHRAHLEWSPSRVEAWAAGTGPDTARLVARIMAERPHPEQGYRSCMGIIRLSGKYGSDRVEAASHRALSTGAVSYQSVKSILSCGLDRIGVNEAETRPLPRHDNLRGPDYYN